GNARGHAYQFIAVWCKIRSKRRNKVNLAYYTFKPENLDVKPALKPVKPDKLIGMKEVKPEQASNRPPKTPPKPVPPPKPTFKKDGQKSRSNSHESSLPDIAPKPKRGVSSASSNKSEESQAENGEPENDEPENDEPVNGHQQNGYHNGNEYQEVGVNEEKPAVDMDADRIEDDEEEDVEGCDSDEFDESENDSDEREETLPNKRQSRIIFGELLDIPDLDFLDPRRKKLFNIAKEILTTEVTYVKTLKLLDEVFHFRLENECRAKGVVPKEALLEIFSNITTINQFHRDFLLPKLEERMKNWDTMPKVGDIFNYLAPFLKMYAEYVKNFDQAMTSLSKWKLKSPKFAAVIEDIQ
ncbi:FYVE, and PH domain-containing 4-like, partial [Paramuricea clavata]